MRHQESDKMHGARPRPGARDRIGGNKIRRFKDSMLGLVAPFGQVLTPSAVDLPFAGAWLPQVELQIHVEFRPLPLLGLAPLNTLSQARIQMLRPLLWRCRQLRSLLMSSR